MPCVNSPYRSFINSSVLKQLKDPNITSINFHRRKLSKRSFGILTKVLKSNENITTLNLSQTQLSKAHLFPQFMKFTESLSSVKVLNISNNGFEYPHMLQFRNVLDQLESLNINANALGDAGLLELLGELEYSSSLRTLKIDDNELTHESAPYLLTFLQKNRFVTLVEFEYNNDFLLSESASIKEQLNANQAVLALFTAIQENNITALRESLDSDPELDAEDPWGDEPLADAIRRGHIDCVRLLVQAGASLTSINREWENALVLAKRLGRTSIASFLETTLNQRFLEAAEEGDLTEVKRLIAIGACPTAYYSGRRESALHLAVKNGHADVVRFLARYDTLLLMKTAEDETPLSLARHQYATSQHDDKSIIMRLQQALLPTINKAFEQKDPAALTILLQGGINPELLIGEQSLLHKAVVAESQAMVATLLLEGADPLSSDNTNIWAIAKTLENKAVFRILKQKAKQLFLTAIRENNRVAMKRYVTVPICQDFIDHLGGRVFHAIKEKQPEIAALLETRLHRHDQYHRVDAFDFQYTSRSSLKSVGIDCEKIHTVLRLEYEHHLRQYVVKKQGKTLNVILPKISFIVSDAVHQKGGKHRRQVVTLDVDHQEQFLHVEDFHRLKQVQNVPKSKSLHRQVLNTSPLQSHNRVNTLYNSNKFHRYFHHSERALYAHLSKRDTMQQLIASLSEKLSGGAGYKVYGVVLHMHSTHSLCLSCEDSMPYQYGPQSEWMLRLTQLLKDSDYKVLTKANTLACAVTVSFDQEAKTSKKRSDPGTTVSPSISLNHAWKRLRTVIAERDDSMSAIKTSACFTNYSSKKRKDSLTPLSQYVKH